MEIFEDIEQGTDEWFAIRAGIPTGSMFKEVIAKKGPRGGVPKGRQTYMYKLAGEIITGEPMDSYSNFDMELGKEREAEARSLYELVKEVEVEQVGFIKEDGYGVSPDGLIGTDGMFETKNAAAHVQVARLLDGGMPAEHVAQVQGQLLTAQRSWCGFMSYCRGMPPLILRIERDEEYIASLKYEIAEFNDELAARVENIRTM